MENLPKLDKFKMENIKEKLLINGTPDADKGSNVLSSNVCQKKKDAMN